MKRTLTTLGALMITTTPALAYGGPETETSLLVTLLLGFGIIIVVGQLIPGVILFTATLKALFGKGEKETAPAIGR